MTDKQRQEFVKKVKGMKIRWSTWDKARYFIPNGEYDVDIIYGINQDDYKMDYWIHEGFNKDKYGKCWEFCNPFEAYIHEVLND